MPAERPAERPSIPVEELRRAVRERVADSSVRAVAKQTGMSVTGLWRFLNGTQPYSKTQQRLRQWYVLQTADAPASTTDVPEDVARAAIELLTRHIPPRRRAAHVRALLIALADPGGREPPWLTVLSAERT